MAGLCNIARLNDGPCWEIQLRMDTEIQYHRNTFYEKHEYKKKKNTAKQTAMEPTMKKRNKGTTKKKKNSHPKK